MLQMLLVLLCSTYCFIQQLFHVSLKVAQRRYTSKFLEDLGSRVEVKCSALTDMLRSWLLELETGQ
jgi:hypothetical protein